MGSSVCLSISVARAKFFWTPFLIGVLLKFGEKVIAANSKSDELLVQGYWVLGQWLNYLTCVVVLHKDLVVWCCPLQKCVFFTGCSLNIVFFFLKMW